MSGLRVAGMVLSVAVGVIGCGNRPAPGGNTRNSEVATHGPGPNRGVVFDLGEYHAELTIDHDRWECAVQVLTGDDASARPLPVAASGLTLTTKEVTTKDGSVIPPMKLRLFPQHVKDGKAARFTGRDPGLNNAVHFAGTVSGEIDGKPLSGEFKE